jgi:hypothetical protein
MWGVVCHYYENLNLEAMEVHDAHDYSYHAEEI